MNKSRRHFPLLAISGALLALAAPASATVISFGAVADEPTSQIAGGIPPGNLAVPMTSADGLIQISGSSTFAFDFGSPILGLAIDSGGGDARPDRINGAESVVFTRLGGTIQLNSITFHGLNSDQADDVLLTLNGSAQPSFGGSSNSGDEAFTFVFAPLTPLTTSLQVGVAAGEFTIFSLDYTVIPESGDIPEPATFSLVGAGLLVLGLLSRRRKKA